MALGKNRNSMPQGTYEPNLVLLEELEPKIPNIPDYQGFALSPLLFVLIMDILQAEIGKEPPWVRLNADDLVI